MAEIRSIYTNNRTDGKTERRTTYVDGAAVRRLRTGDQPERQRRQEERFSVHTARRVKAKERMGLGYGMFLAVALGVAMWVCVGYLKLQADNTARAKNIAALETQLSTLKDENDDEYNRVTTSVDLEKIRDIAMNELGMVYANEDQVVLYDDEGSDYVKQYAEIPEDDKSLKGALGTISR